MTLLVIRHASSSAPRPQLPAQLNGHRVLCSDCASLSEAQWQAEGGALQAALERLPAQYIELQAPSEPGLEARLRLQHGPAAVVIDQRSQQAGYPLSLAIVGRRLAQEG
ncbi:hypothetical protein [Stenotrophomonas maltophilia]|uniref:hypothetical protein n=1 Tax=Stenotrophomonas maltophilia TaxID=40324 RepID=UPI0005B71B18|nr:hypothetical protein [Stenotrophomonas maltophilia]KIS36813.1 hypothetical protein WJ66_04360 [Stenotrophomonas maltophilia WJ66]MCF3460681.1 hypothetical protein [Stenotrophomonas maltophilia]MCF3517594.1 hypothetical protein [Stenotrophomonas maltophilia]PZS60959.1 hypothetical protein A7X58_06195 [Stenotrophomonas maltophilia]UXB28411.1 hypothetical protein K7568_00910 [Stenotrophomonas maltophilia]